MSINSSVTSGESEDLQSNTATETFECNRCKRNFTARISLKANINDRVMQYHFKTFVRTYSELELKEPNEHFIYQWGKIDGKKFTERVEQVY